MIFLFPKVSIAQSQLIIDSLLKKLPTANDTSYSKMCMDLADEFINSKQIVLSFQYADSALLRAKNGNNLRIQGIVYNRLGLLNIYVSDYSKAIDNFDKALRLFKKNGHRLGQISAILNMGNAYYYNTECNKSEKCFRLALQLYRANPIDETSLTNIYNNLGSACACQEKYQEGLYWFKKALEISEKRRDSISIAYAYNNIGSNLNVQDKVSEALPYFEKALAIKLKHGSNTEKADGYVNIASAFYSIKKYDKALLNLEKALMFIDTSVYNTGLKRLYNDLADNYEQLNKIELSNKYHKLLRHLNLEIFAKEIAAQIEQKDMMNEFSKSHLRDSLVQASRIEKQTAQISRSNTVKYFLLIIVGVIIIFMAILYKRYKVSQAQKEEISRQKHLVDEKQTEIMDSIKYARRIQESLLPKEKYIERVLTNIRDKK
ncbi:MAG: tetratricopeptide repeat protein [Bacteroidetes bacterium]|nr:tetratricopeptide repeat protein [Bacteroidota bacterium]